MQDCLCTVFAKEVCSRAFRTDPFTVVTIYCYRRYHLICKHIVCLVGTVITCYLYPMAAIITIENISRIGKHDRSRGSTYPQRPRYFVLYAAHIVLCPECSIVLVEKLRSGKYFVIARIISTFIIDSHKLDLTASYDKIFVFRVGIVYEQVGGSPNRLQRCRCDRQYRILLATIGLSIFYQRRSGGIGKP